MATRSLTQLHLFRADFIFSHSKPYWYLATWSLLCGSGAWSARLHHVSVVLPSSSTLVVMAGYSHPNLLNDAWSSDFDAGQWPNNVHI